MAEKKKDYISLGADGLAAVAGYILVYNSDPATGEFIGVTEEYLLAGVGIPAHSRPDAPPEAGEGYVSVVTDAGWQLVPDYRGKTAYAKNGSGTFTVKVPGELSEGYTAEAPKTAYDSWTEAGWITDDAALKASVIAAADAEKQRKIDDANAYINGRQWPSKLALARLADAEKAEFNRWLDYLDALTAVDTSTAPDISWPERPGS